MSNLSAFLQQLTALQSGHYESDEAFVEIEKLKAYLLSPEGLREARNIFQLLDFFPEGVVSHLGINSDLLTKYYQVKASAALASGDCETTIQLANQALAIKSDPKSLSYRGMAEIETGEIDKGIGDLTEAIRQQPEDDMFYVNRAIGWYKKGSYDKSVNDLHIAIDLNPDYADSFLILGLSYQKLSKIPQASAYLKRACYLGYGSERSWGNITDLLLALHEYFNYPGILKEIFLRLRSLNELLRYRAIFEQVTEDLRFWDTFKSFLKESEWVSKNPLQWYSLQAMEAYHTAILLKHMKFLIPSLKQTVPSPRSVCRISTISFYPRLISLNPMKEFLPLLLNRRLKLL